MYTHCIHTTLTVAHTYLSVGGDIDVQHPVVLCLISDVRFCLKECSQELVSQLEQLQGKMDRLGNECRIMRNKLEEEELKAQTVCTKGKTTTNAFYCMLQIIHCFLIYIHFYLIIFNTHM